MKTTGLTFREVKNRIKVGLCSRFRYGTCEAWVVNYRKLRLIRSSINGITLQEYAERNHGVVNKPKYTVIT